MTMMLNSPFKVNGSNLKVEDGRGGVGMRLKHRWCLVGAAVLLFCMLLYVPVLVSFHTPTAFEWTMSRNLRRYIHPDNQTALISGEGMCSGDHPPFVAIVVCSAVPNFKSRQAIRETWGSEANFNQSVKLVFLLGRTDNDSRQDEVQHESDIHGDIIQEDFLDTYNNLTLKSITLLKWASTSCRSAQYIMKTDDDMFINVPVLVDLLRRKGRKQMLLGCLICGAVPVKDKSSKWYAPSFLFAERVYPNYLSGTGYVLSQDVIHDLYVTALDTPLFHLEDVFVTGICARQLKLRPMDCEGFSYLHRPLNPCIYQKIITGHHMKPSELQLIWTQMRSSYLRCDNKKVLGLKRHSPRCH